jgi:competence protein ComEC
VAVAALLMGGIVAGRVWAAEVGWVGIAVGLGMVVWTRTRVAGMAVFIFALGMFLYGERYRVRSADDLRLILSGEAELVTVRGRLLETPEVREFSAGKSEVAYSYATLEVMEIQKRGEEWRAARGRVATRLRGELTEEFFRGRTVEVAGVIAFPTKAAAPGLFDYRAYLYNTRVFHQLKCDSTNDWQLLSFETMPLTERFRRWAEKQLQRGLRERDEASEIIAAMTLGLRSSLSGEMADVFMRTGTMHIIAISGLHVACITGFLCFVLVRGFGVSRGVGGVVVLGIVWFYTAATGLQSSAVRSALMATVFILSWVLRRPGELLNTLAASAVLILVVQPEQLFQASFQLSFSVVLVIGLMASLLANRYPNWSYELRAKILRLDPLLPYEFVPRWKKMAGWALGFVFADLAVSAASWIGSLPLTAYYFNTVTPVSLLANLVAVPLSSVSLGATVVSILAWPVAPVSNYVAWVFMTWTIAVVKFFGAFSFGYFYVPRPNGIFMTAYAAAVAVLFVPRLRVGFRKVSSAVGIAGLSVFWFGSVYAGKPVATLTVLPCAGTPVLVEEKRTLLIDTSSERDADYMVKRFLRAKGCGTVDGLVLTHGDAQVVGGFSLVWLEFEPEKVFTSAVKMRSPGYRRAIAELEKSDRWKTLAAGEEVEGWSVLYPPRVERGFPRADDNAVVLRKSIDAWTVLHVSDLGESGQKKLLESGNNLRADIVIAGMPEQGEPLTDGLLEKIRPKIIVLGTAEYPYKAQGSPELRKRLEESGAKIFYVDQEKAVTISVKPKECVVTTMEGKRISLGTNR